MAPVPHIIDVFRLKLSEEISKGTNPNYFQNITPVQQEKEAELMTLLAGHGIYEGMIRKNWVGDGDDIVLRVVTWNTELATVIRLSFGIEVEVA